MSVVIEAKSLGRYFGTIKAVDGVSFEVSRGDVLGFLGPNGAGKSTTMKMLTGFLTPSFGTARIGGFDVVEQSREAKKLVGYLPENAPLYGEMTALAFLKFIAEVRQVEPQLLKASLDRVIALTGLGPVLEQRVETLSKGFKRRVGLAQALIHDPPILILDEPTDGLDPNQKHDVRTLINTMAQEKCIILSTHILEEVDAVCNRVIIISNGKLITDDRPENLRAKAKSCGAVTLNFDAKAPGTIRQELEKVSGVANVIEENSPDGRTKVVAYPKVGQEIFRAVLKEAEVKKWRFSGVSVDAGQLDEVFRALT